MRELFAGRRVGARAWRVLYCRRVTAIRSRRRVIKTCIDFHTSERRYRVKKRCVKHGAD
jgi:hypothetical protein